jgi:phosphatidylserine decarboxylase
MLSGKLSLIIGATAAYLFSLWFFRNPPRSPVDTEDLYHIPLLSPADGKVVSIIQSDHDIIGPCAYTIAIFLSPLDVHVQWTPCTGTVRQVCYTPGEHFVAYAPKSSAANEHNDLYLQHADGYRILVRQIAGLVARRICCWVQENEALHAGEKYGMIKFGSRVEITLPEATQICVTVGQRVYGGHTIVGDILK